MTLGLGVGNLHDHPISQNPYTPDFFFFFFVTLEPRVE